MAKKVEQELDIPDIKRKPVILDVACRDCLFFKRMAVYAKPCREFGTVPNDTTCRRFTPDPVLLQLGPDLHRVMRILSNVPNPTLLASIAKSQGKVSRKGFKLGQTVVFRVLTKDFINNYASAYVISTVGNQVVLAGLDNFTAIVDLTSILTLEQWEIKRDELIAAKRINDPLGLQKLYTNSGSKLKLYTPDIMAKGKKRRGRVKLPRKPLAITLHDGNAASKKASKSKR